jgi:8-oxo-dGTP pyrophosphatase MutT (NUDIX family)
VTRLAVAVCWRDVGCGAIVAQTARPRRRDQSRVPMGRRPPSVALQQLARIEAGLRKPQPTRTGDRSSVVAAIVRQPAIRPVASKGDDGLDLLFILRGGSTDPQKGSRWSGQVAFPGGHVEEGETDLQAVARECREEVGIEDLEGPNYRVLGRVADRSVYRTEKKSSLLVRCYVVEQLVHEPLTADPAEVAACGWAPLRSLLDDQYIRPLPEVGGALPLCTLVSPGRFPALPGAKRC